MTYEDDWENDYDEDYEDEWDGDPCSRCGPWCEHWGGDGLCDLVIEQLAADDEAYQANHVRELVRCPICGQYYTQYDVKTDKLWEWPGDWFNPMIALGVYAMYGAPKGLIHSFGGHLHHIWVGEGEFREEKLIRLLGRIHKNG